MDNEAISRGVDFDFTMTVTGENGENDCISNDNRAELKLAIKLKRFPQEISGRKCGMTAICKPRWGYVHFQDGPEWRSYHSFEIVYAKGSREASTSSARTGIRTSEVRAEDRDLITATFHAETPSDWKPNFFPLLMDVRCCGDTEHVA